MTDPTVGTSTQEPQSDGPLVRLQNVDVALARNVVLHNLNWELRAGEHWAVVGANGSGKTSFLRLIAGTLWPAPGSGTRRYDFDGESQIDAVQALGKITLVGHELQDRYTRLGWNFDAVDVVLSGLKRTDIPRHESDPKDRIRARGLLRKLKLLHLAERPFLELSRGEQRRVLIARGLAFKPTVLILDEPVAGLDAQSRRALNETVEQISESTTVLCSYHEAVNLPSNMNRILRLSDGHVIESGPISPSINAYGDHSDTSAAAVSSSPPVAATSEKTLIEVQHADVWLDKHRALADINWKLMVGEHWQLTGPNGAGKSTFLRLLHGQLRPAKGGKHRVSRNRGSRQCLVAAAPDRLGLPGAPSRLLVPIDRLSVHRLRIRVQHRTDAALEKSRSGSRGGVTRAIRAGRPHQTQCKGALLRAISSRPYRTIRSPLPQGSVA